MTSGTRLPLGGTKIVTLLPNLAFVPALGSCLTTVPGVPVELLSVCTLTWNPAPLNVLCAWPTGSCLTLGTDTIFGPVDTTRVTLLPAGTALPLGGLVLITMFFGTVASGCLCTVYFSPAAVISL